MAQGLNTGINVGQAQVLEPYHVKGQGESPFAYIAKKRDIAEEKRKVEGQKYRDAFIRMKLPSLEGTHPSDQNTIARVFSQFHQAIQEANMNGTMARDYADIERKFDEIGQMVQLSKGKWSLQKKIGADREKQGQDAYDWYGDEHYNELAKRYDDKDYNISNLDKWREANSAILGNAEQYVTQEKKFDDMAYRAARARESSVIRQSIMDKTAYVGDDGRVYRNGEAVYDPSGVSVGDYAANRGLRKLYAEKLKGDKAAQEKFKNEADPVQAYFVDTMNKIAGVNYKEQNISAAPSKGSNTSASASAGGGGGWVEDDITFVPNKLSGEFLVENIRDNYNAKVSSDEEDRKKKDPEYKAPTVEKAEDIPGMNAKNIETIRSQEIPKLDFHLKSEKPLNLKTGKGNDMINLGQLSIFKSPFDNKFYIAGSQVMGVNADGVTLKFGNQKIVPYEENKGIIEATIKGKNLVEQYEQKVLGKKSAATNTGNKGTAAPKKEVKMSFVEWKKKNPSGTAAQYKEYHKQ